MIIKSKSEYCVGSTSVDIVVAVTLKSLRESIQLAGG